MTIHPLTQSKFAPGVYQLGNRANKWSKLGDDSELIRASLTSMLPLTINATMENDGGCINEILSQMGAPLRLTSLELNAQGFISAARFK